MKELHKVKSENSQFLIRLLAFHERYPSPYACSLIMDYCSGSDLYNYMQENFWDKTKPLADQHIPEAFIWRTMTQCTLGLAQMHTGYGTSLYGTGEWKPIIHHDMKPENVFLDKGATVTEAYAKLGDFGMAEYYDADSVNIAPFGTFLFYPPEQPLSTPAKDVWGLGCILYVMAKWQDPPTKKKVGHEVHPNDDFLQQLTEKDLKTTMDLRKEYGPRKVLPLNKLQHVGQTRVYSKALNSLLMLCFEGDYHRRVKSDVLASWLTKVTPEVTRMLEGGKRPNFDLKVLCETWKEPPEDYKTWLVKKPADKPSG